MNTLPACEIWYLPYQRISKLLRAVTMLSSTTFTDVSLQPNALLSTHIYAVGSHETSVFVN